MTNYKGYDYTIEQDDYSETPLDWTTPEERGAWFVLKHDNYILPFEVDIDLGEFNSWTEVAEHLSKSGEYGENYKFVRWAEHGTVAVSLRDDEGGADWDAGIAGIIIGRTTEEIENAFRDWQYFTEGDVWTVTVEDADGELVDCHSGIMGYEQAEAEAEAIINYQLSLPRSSHKPLPAGKLHN